MMKLKIKANTLITHRYLMIRTTGVEFCETAFIGGKRRFRFDEVQTILMAPDNTLSFQVGNEVFSIPVKARKRRHQEAIDVFVREVHRANDFPQPSAT